MPTAAELKIKRRLLQQQVSLIDDKVDRVTEILEKKRAGKPKRITVDPNEDLSNPLAEERFKRKIAALKGGAAMPRATLFPSSSKVVQNRNKNLLREAEKDRRATNEAIKAQAGKKILKKGSVVPGPRSLFPTRYSRGELPCAVEHLGSKLGLSWVCDLNDLDYEHYLPIFFDGIRCTEHPYDFMARHGVHEMLKAAQGDPDRIIPIIPDLINPLRNAICTKDLDIMVATLKCMRELVLCNQGVGEHLVPYYKVLLYPLGPYLEIRRNLGDAMDYSQGKGADIANCVIDTLEVIEKTGGPGAGAHIKALVPTYESCLKTF